jgi:polyhydroxyalkanoate synthase
VTGPAVRLGAALALRPLAVARRGAGAATDVLRIAVDGRGAPLGRAQRALHDAAAGLVDDAGLDPADAGRCRAALDGVFALLGGPRPDPPAPPAPAPPAVRIGADVAATPGGVVARTPRYELIQYLPQTEVVRAVPLLVVPPPTHRHYLVDLGPGRSAVEHLVRHDQQVLALSWAAGAADDLDGCLDAVREALETCRRIARDPRVALLAVGAAEALVAEVAAAQPDRVTAVTVVAPPAPGSGPDAARAWLADELPVPGPLRRALAAPRPAPADAYRVDDPLAPWRTDHAAWLSARSGDAHDAPPRLGGRGIHAVAPAPGEYVLA